MVIFSGSLIGWERSIPVRAATVPSERTSFWTSEAIRRRAKRTLSRASSSGATSGSVFFILIPRCQCEASQVFHHLLVRFRRQETNFRYHDVINPFLICAKLGTAR